MKILLNLAFTVLAVMPVMAEDAIVRSPTHICDRVQSIATLIKLFHYDGIGEDAARRAISGVINRLNSFEELGLDETIALAYRYDLVPGDSRYDNAQLFGEIQRGKCQRQVIEALKN